MTSATLPHLDAGSDTHDTISATLTTHGGVIVENMLDQSTLAAINTELDGHVEAADPEMEHLNPFVGEFFGRKTRHVCGVAAKSPTFVRELLIHPALLAACDAIIGPNCAGYQLNVAHVLDRGPGSGAQMLHRDEDVWIHVPRPHPQLQVASITALVDFTAEIGATQVVPGSHEWARERWPEPHEVAVAEMPAGSSVLYLGSTLHGAGANVSDDVKRRGLHLSYVVGWLRTEENNTLSTPPEIAAQMPRRAQELVGYKVHDAIESLGGYLGMVELRDPVEMLADGSLR